MSAWLSVAVPLHRTGDRPAGHLTGDRPRPATKETLAVALHAGIMDEVDAARKKLERFTAMDEGIVRPDTILERVNELLARISPGSTRN